MAIEVKDGIVQAGRDLEGGLEKCLEIRLSAMISVQTGINEPRYVPISGIRPASRREIPLL